jgi:hypothetical protein
MQNFKQFLKEDNNAEYEIKLYLEYMIRYEDIVDYLNEQKENIIDTIKQKTNVNTIDINIRQHSFSIILTIEDTQLNNLKSIENTIIDILEQHNNDSFQYFNQDTNIELILLNNQLPKNIKINFPQIYISPMRPISFKGINKIIGDFKILDIRNAKNITDSILGLLLLNKSDRKISVIFSTLQWTKIVNNCLMADTDILECQEELITNGLRQYAKL